MAEAEKFIGARRPPGLKCWIVSVVLSVAMAPAVDSFGPAHAADKVIPGSSRTYASFAKLDEGEKREVELRLRRVGHAPGTIDGIIDEDALEAISDFNARFGLPPAVAADRDLLRRLRGHGIGETRLLVVDGAGVGVRPGDIVDEFRRVVVREGQELLLIGKDGQSIGKVGPYSGFPAEGATIGLDNRDLQQLRSIWARGETSIFEALIRDSRCGSGCK